jgi:hypothetical protein
MRAATNPGGLGHEWVKKRYRIRMHGARAVGEHPTRPFISAFVGDNPYLNAAEYREALSELDPVTREQLLNGDWDVSTDGRFKREWLHYFSRTHDTVVMGPGGRAPAVWPLTRCWCFMTVDPAASIKSGPGDRGIWRRAPSQTVISVWLVTPGWDLLWWDCVCLSAEIPDVCAAIKKTFKLYSDSRLTQIHPQPSFVGIEANGLGIGVYQTMKREGLPVRDLRPQSMDKLVRATDAANRMEQGKIWFPDINCPYPSGFPRTEWIEACEGELLRWTGHPHEAADRIDTLSYAAMQVSYRAGWASGKSTSLPSTF